MVESSHNTLVTSGNWNKIAFAFHLFYPSYEPGCVAQSVGHLTGKSEVLGLIPGLATYSQTCLKGSPKGRTKSGCLRQVTP